MAKLFFDHLVNLEELEKEINSVARTPEEKLELWQIVDEMIHHKVFDCILENLDKEHHEEFMDHVHVRPHDHNIFDFLKDKIKDDIEETIRQRVSDLASEILLDIQVEE